MYTLVEFKTAQTLAKASKTLRAMGVAHSKLRGSFFGQSGEEKGDYYLLLYPSDIKEAIELEHRIRANITDYVSIHTLEGA